jgi:hypothetical protein
MMQAEHGMPAAAAAAASFEPFLLLVILLASEALPSALP